MDIYLGNLPYSTTEEDVTGIFAPFGPVERVKLIIDRETGRSKGFAFVTLGDQSKLQGAIDAVNGLEYQGRLLRANASEPKPFNKPSGGGYGGERRGGGGGGGFKGGYGGGSKGGYGDRRGGGGHKGGGYGDDRRGGGSRKGGYEGGGDW